MHSYQNIMQNLLALIFLSWLANGIAVDPENWILYLEYLPYTVEKLFLPKMLPCPAICNISMNHNFDESKGEVEDDWSLWRVGKFSRKRNIALALVIIKTACFKSYVLCCSYMISVSNIVYENEKLYTECSNSLKLYR